MPCCQVAGVTSYGHRPENWCLGSMFLMRNDFLTENWKSRAPDFRLYTTPTKLYWLHEEMPLMIRLEMELRPYCRSPSIKYKVGPFVCLFISTGQNTQLMDGEEWDIKRKRSKTKVLICFLHFLNPSIRKSYATIFLCIDLGKSTATEHCAQSSPTAVSKINIYIILCSGVS